jgi:hypothetical protein
VSLILSMPMCFMGIVSFNDIINYVLCLCLQR